MRWFPRVIDFGPIPMGWSWNYSVARFPSVFRYAAIYHRTAHGTSAWGITQSAKRLTPFHDKV